MNFMTTALLALGLIGTVGPPAAPIRRGQRTARDVGLNHGCASGRLRAAREHAFRLHRTIERCRDRK